MNKEKSSNSRIIYIDNLRTLMILLVVLIHINVTYSGIGGWYYVENNVNDIDTFNKIISAMFSMFTQAYFMGFMFLIAGYFIPFTFERKGIRSFLKNRLIRLGVPVLVYILMINPIILFIILKDYFNYQHSFLSNYGSYLTSFNFLGGTGPLWFALTLLLFSTIYAMLKYFKLNIQLPIHKLSPNLIVITLILFVTTVTFIVRLYYPFGSSFYNLQFCFFPQYIVLFIIGIIFYKKNLLNKLNYQFSMNWFKYGLLFGSIFWALIIFFGGALEGKEQLYFGGFYLQSVGYALFESIICASIVLGLLVLFREKLNVHIKWSKFLADQSFGVYVFHAPILILISYSLRDFSLYPILKSILITLITLPTTYIFTYFIRKIKILKTIFS